MVATSRVDQLAAGVRRGQIDKISHEARSVPRAGTSKHLNTFANDTADVCDEQAFFSPVPGKYRLVYSMPPQILQIGLERLVAALGRLDSAYGLSEEDGDSLSDLKRNIAMTSTCEARRSLWKRMQCFS
jgi:hypothetical protein